MRKGVYPVERLSNGQSSMNTAGRGGGSSRKEGTGKEDSCVGKGVTSNNHSEKGGKGVLSFKIPGREGTEEEGQLKKKKSP